MKLKLVKNRPIFSSFQGEGARVGTLATFIRVFGCNLDCSFCDTKYSWDPSAPNFGGEMHEIDEVNAQLRLVGIQPNVVMTGGEPTQQIVPLIHLMEKIQGWANPHFTIETNGTNWTEQLNMFNLVSVSPKPWRFHEDWDSLSEMMKCLHFPDLQFKIVVSNMEELDNTLSFMDGIRTVNPMKKPLFYIQPETGKGRDWVQEITNVLVARAAKPKFKSGLQAPLLDLIRILPQVHALTGVE